MLGLTEMLGAPAIAVHIAGIAFILGRLPHGLHFNGHIGFWARPGGMVLTLTTSGVLALGLIAHAISQMG